MVAAMGTFALADTLIKLLSDSITPPQIMFLLTIGGLIVFTAILLVKRDRFRDRRAFSGVMIVRYVSEIVAMVGMLSALSYVPLSVVGAIVQATPLVVVLGAVLWLGEKVSWRRWAAILVGFCGVLLIVQPGGQSFDANVLWAVLSMLGLAIRDLTTRVIPPDISSAGMSVYTMLASIPFAAGWVALGGYEFIPAETNWLFVVVMSLLGAVGYLLLIASIRIADISVVSPFRYARLLFMLVLGIAIFGERPDVWMLSGAGLIIASGLYAMWRERKARAEE